MEITYYCQRCKKLSRAKVTLTAFRSKNYTGKKHNRVDCLECGKYIKFMGEKELRKIKSESAIDREITNAELNFKLDLILDHLGVKNG